VIDIRQLWSFGLDEALRAEPGKLYTMSLSGQRVMIAMVGENAINIRYEIPLLIGVARGEGQVKIERRRVGLGFCRRAFCPTCNQQVRIIYFCAAQIVCRRCGPGVVRSIVDKVRENAESATTFASVWPALQ
jgi:hypothetical protein